MIYSFYHITDVHYYSKRNFACDYRKLPQPSTETCIMVSEEAFKKALEIIENDEETSTVIITGDLTNHGDEYSHNEVRDLLQDFTEKGGNPYVVTDSHDYPEFYIYSIDEKGEKIPAEHIPEEKAVEMYHPFGRDKAFDTYREKTTYIAEILPGLFYINMGYREKADGTPYFSDGLMQWVKEHITEINEKGGTVICGTHRPIVTPSPAYEVLGKTNVFSDGEKRAKELADMGVRLFFSGHTHIQCIKEITSEKGNKLFSVQTSSLAGFPPKMRKITIDTDKGTADIRTIDMDLPELGLGMSYTEYARNGFLGIIEKIPYNMEHDVEAFLETEGGVKLPEELILKYPEVVKFIGRKLNGITYKNVANFSKKYHNLTEADYADVKDKKFVELLLELIGNLYRGNASYTPDTVEYKIMTASVKKIEKLLSTFRIDIRKLVCGYTLTEIIGPLLYNSGPDDDNISVSIK